MPAEGITQGLDREEVHIAAEYLTKLGNHVHPIVQTPLSILSEADQHVDIAVRAEVVPKDRAEDRKFSDFPPSAEIAHTFLGNRNVALAHIHTHLADIRE